MSIPSDNNTFSLGDFSGYQVDGRCKVVDFFDYHSPFSTNVTRIKPFGTGHYFALLDDPTLVDANGSRLKDPALPTPADTSGISFKDDFGITSGIDGAILEALDVSIPKGKRLQFRWRFLCYDTSAGQINDFSLFDAIFDSGQLAHRKVLAQSSDLSGGGITGWATWNWQPEADFHGTLRWVASNGTQQNPPVANSSSRARPSALLLDSIRMLSA